MKIYKIKMESNEGQILEFNVYSQTPKDAFNDAYDVVDAKGWNHHRYEVIEFHLVK